MSRERRTEGDMRNDEKEYFTSGLYSFTPLLVTKRVVADLHPKQAVCPINVILIIHSSPGTKPRLMEPARPSRAKPTGPMRLIALINLK